MCKYNSFDTYPIVHNTEVHMQTTTQEDTEVHMKTAIKDENKTQEDDIFNDVVLLDDQQYIYNKLFIDEQNQTEGKESLEYIKGMKTSPLRISSKAGDTSEIESVDINIIRH